MSRQAPPAAAPRPSYYNHWAICVKNGVDLVLPTDRMKLQRRRHEIGQILSERTCTAPLCNLI